MSSYSAPLEVLTDVSGAVSFGWVDDGVYLASFMRSLSARLTQVFLSRVREAWPSQGRVKCFADARWLESYDLVARRCFVEFVRERREMFEQIVLLSWAGVEMSSKPSLSYGDGIVVTDVPADFEARLLAVAPLAQVKLGAWGEDMPRLRWAPRH